MTVVAVAAIVTPRTAASRAAAPSSSPSSRIKHVILIFQENRSFDEVLGAFCQQQHRCDGAIGNVRLSNGSVVAMRKSPDIITPDPSHTVSTQLTDIDGGRMDGWNHISSCYAHGVNQCLTYYTPSQIPSLSAFAGKYVVSDRTFSMQDSPSWGGHIYAAAATQDGFTGDIPHTAPGVKSGPGWGCDSKRVGVWIDAAGHRSDQPACIPAAPGVLNKAQYPFGGAFRSTKVPNVPTIFDRLGARHLSWKLYSSIHVWSICPNFGDCYYSSQRQNVVSPNAILTDAQHGTLPSYSVLLPGGPGGTGQHPPASMLRGDNWIGKVVKALQSGPEWSSTAVFITYDDCGCFYDHVAPGHNPDGTQQGIREPMVIVSPYAKHGATDHKTATLSSVLRFTEETFGLAPLGVNDARAYDYSGAFDFTKAPTAGRVWPAPRPIPAAEAALLAKQPPDDDDPT